MEPRPLGHPDQIAECATDLKRLSEKAHSLASQSLGAVKNPGFSGLGAIHFAMGGTAAAFPLNHQAAVLAALAAEVAAAATKLRTDQAAWDRRAEAERLRRAEAAARERNGGNGPTDYRGQL